MGARPPRAVGMLLFGDSVDFRIPQYMCNLVHGEEPQPFTKSDQDDDDFRLAGEGTMWTSTVGASSHYAPTLVVRGDLLLVLLDLCSV